MACQLVLRIFIAPKAVELYAYAQNERYSWKMRGGLQASFLVCVMAGEAAAAKVQLFLEQVFF